MGGYILDTGQIVQTDRYIEILEKYKVQRNQLLSAIREHETFWGNAHVFTENETYAKIHNKKDKALYDLAKQIEGEG